MSDVWNVWLIELITYCLLPHASPPRVGTPRTRTTQDFVAGAGARVRLENPLGRGNFLSGLKLSGERDCGLGLARFSAVCPLGGHMYANGL
jgi:hypothetical protein